MWSRGQGIGCTARLKVNPANVGVPGQTIWHELSGEKNMQVPRLQRTEPSARPVIKWEGTPDSIKGRLVSYYRTALQLPAEAPSNWGTSVSIRTYANNDKCELNPCRCASSGVWAASASTHGFTKMVQIALTVV